MEYIDTLLIMEDNNDDSENDGTLFIEYLYHL